VQVGVGAAFDQRFVDSILVGEELLRSPVDIDIGDRGPDE